VRVIWTHGAVAQLEALHDYISQTSPEYARRIVDRLTSRTIQISALPFSGRTVPEYDLTEVREVIEGSYRVIYLIKEDEDRIEVLALIHSSRKGLKLLE
jgi:plasmid stabilization system protein ParE